MTAQRSIPWLTMQILIYVEDGLYRLELEMTEYFTISIFFSNK